MNSKSLFLMKNSTTYEVFVGIDISKLTLDVWLDHPDQSQTEFIQVENSSEGFKRLGDWLGECGADPEQTILCGEHTGRYGEHLASWAGQSQWDYAVVKTTALKKVSPEHHRKSDRYDASLLAEYARRYTDKLSLVKTPDRAVKQLKRLRKERRFMVDQRARLAQKISEADYHDADMECITEYYQQQIDLLSRQIDSIEKRIKTLIKSHPSLDHRYRQVLTAPGIGKVIASFWVSLFAGEEQLNPRQISSRFGFAPHTYQSGTSVKGRKRSSGFGNGDMRRIMNQGARSVATHNPHYKAYYQKKLAEGKGEKLIMNNIINKIIRTVCSMWNHDVDYDPGHIQKMKKIHQIA